MSVAGICVPVPGMQRHPRPQASWARAHESPSPNASSGISGSRAANSGVVESGIDIMLGRSLRIVEMFSSDLEK